MSRKLIRPTLDRPRTRPPEAPRRKPTGTTQAEASYLLQAVASRSTLVVRFLGGVELRGRIDYYDRDCIKLQREGQPDLLLRKDKIKYYWVEKEPRAAALAPEPAPSR